MGVGRRSAKAWPRQSHSTVWSPWHFEPHPESEEIRREQAGGGEPSPRRPWPLPLSSVGAQDMLCASAFAWASVSGPWIARTTPPASQTSVVSPPWLGAETNNPCEPLTVTALDTPDT